MILLFIYFDFPLLRSRTSKFMRFIALMMEAASTSETLVNLYQTTRRNIPEDSHLLNIKFFQRGFTERVAFEGRSPALD
jgi:hypothetical protein